MGKEQELVMGVPTHQLFEKPEDYFAGFMPDGPATDSLRTKINQYACFRYRGHCENDPSFKQIIPYCVITVEERIFIYQRKTGSDETRLHNKASIGIGGHINPTNGFNAIPGIIHHSMLRELNEEVVINGSKLYSTQFFKFAGMINWDKDEVGKVHLGFVYEIVLPPFSNVKVREKDKLEGDLLPIKWLKRYPKERWESWSLLVIDDYLCFP